MNKKRLLMLIAMILVVGLTFAFAACGDKNDPHADKPGGNTPVTENNDGDKPDTGDKSLKDFTGITFENQTTDYDGAEHKIEVSGDLKGATVAYTNNIGRNAGVYDATAKITKRGFNELILTAKLTINKIDMDSSIEMQDKTVSYDKQKHSLVVEGDLPEGATIVYSGGEDKNSATNAGTHKITATIKAQNYNDKILTANLVINKIDMSTDLTFNDKVFEYDTLLHSITIEGLVPEGAGVVYAGGENGKNGATNVGSYTITATIKAPNYNDKVLSAVLIIKTTEEDLNVVLFNDKLYFQNPLHNNYFYEYDKSTSEVNFISYDSPISYAEANGKLYFFSKGLLSTSICSFDGTNVVSLLEVNGENMLTDGTNLYYVNNSFLKKENNGIYKIAIDDLENQNSDPTPIKISGNKASCLAYNNGYVYYANKNDDNKLYRVSTTTANSDVKVYDYKVSELIAYNGALYFNRHHNLTAALYRIVLSANPDMPIVDDGAYVNKLTSSKGKDLTIIGTDLYFINIDLAVSTICGDGIYKVAINGGDILSSKVIDANENNVYALAGNSNALYYYKHNDKHLYQYDVATCAESDVMASFVPPEVKNVIASYYEKTFAYNGELYYININDGGKLYKYNIANGNEFRITGLEVADFTINGDYLYMATVRLKVNFDLYKLNLLNGDMVRISTDKCYYPVFEGNQIYYMNFSGKNTLNKMNLDGTGNVELYEGIADIPITLKDGKIYFVDNPKIGYKKMLTYTISNGEVSEINEGNCSPNEYIVVGNKLIVVNTANNNKLEIRDLITKDVLNTVQLGTVDDARSLFVIKNDLYFYRNVASGSAQKGLYKLDLVNNNATPILIDNMVRDDKTYYVSNAQIIDGKLYFMDVWQVQNSVPEPTYSSGKLCVYDFVTKTIEELN